MSVIQSQQVIGLCVASHYQFSQAFSIASSDLRIGSTTLWFCQILLKNKFLQKKNLWSSLSPARNVHVQPIPAMVYNYIKVGQTLP